MDAEYVSLRDEITKWQDRRIVFSQVGLTLVTAYTGYMISKDVGDGPVLSWQMVSILPLLILSITMHVTKLFELFHLRAAAYLVVYHNSNWERVVGKASFSNAIWKMGYNRSMGLLYLLIACSSTFIFAQRFPGSEDLIANIMFAACTIIFLFVFFTLFRFKSAKEKQELIGTFEAIKAKD